MSPRAKKLRISTTAGGEWPPPADEGLAAAPRQQQTPLEPTSRYSHNLIVPAQPIPKPVLATTNTNLSPCHICHRKPTKRAELDSYADCEGCGERTCYVCIRECLGWVATPTSATRLGRGHHNEETLMGDGDDGSDNNDAVDGDGHHNGGSRSTEENRDDDGDSCRRGDGRNQSFSMEDAPSSAAEEIRPGDRSNRGGTAWGEGGGRGHRGRICSQCCVEEGPEGEAVCLGCLGT